MTIAVFGGSFDPPHLDHQCIVDDLSQRFARVLVIPVYKHAFDKKSTAFEHRVNMCLLGLGQGENVEVLDLEKDLEQPSYTLHTLQAIKKIYDDDLRLVVGSDILAEVRDWFKFNEVNRLAPLFIFGRRAIHDGFYKPKNLTDISSTEIRNRIKNTSEVIFSKEEKRNHLLKKLNPKVLDYIEKNKLYVHTDC